ncbi:MAG: hypothetical protein ACU0B7_00700 [Paracoccaceae bacterium]
MTPNGFAYLVLIAWPFVSLALFRTQPVGRALIASILIAYLFLPPPPTGFDLPLIPTLDKATIPSLTAFTICFFMYGRKMKFLPGPMPAKILMLVFIFSPILTAVTNGEPVVFGNFFIQGLGIKEGLSIVISQAITLMPFVLAMNFLSKESDLRDILIALVMGGLVYSLPMLVEVRLSPQLNTWIYGFFQHSFGQMMRDGGYRPIVFLYHGLWVAFFCFTAIVAAFSLYGSEKRNRKSPHKYLFSGIYLLCVLILCKSLGSLLYAFAVIPLMLLFNVRIQLRVAIMIAVLAVSYPVLKGNQLIPERTLIEKAYEYSPQRAESLHFRLINEALILERASQKSLLGWGSHGRPFIHNTFGQILTVPDGRWVITLGSLGWFGYIAEFGLIALPLLLLNAKIGTSSNLRISPIMAGASIILAINLVDMLPNATLTPLTWIMAGSFLGIVQSLERNSIKHLRSRPAGSQI